MSDNIRFWQEIAQNVTHWNFKNVSMLNKNTGESLVYNWDAAHSS